MPNVIQIKRSTVSGRTPNTTHSANTSFIDIGELALNIPDKKLFSSNGSVLFEIGSNLTSLSVSSEARIGANTLFVNSSVVQITVNDTLKFADNTTQNTAFRVYDTSGTRIA